MSPGSGQRGSILFADDDAMMLKATSSALELAGFAVTAVIDAAEALEALVLRPPDALLIDVDMPGNKNLELVQRLRLEGSLLPIVILTGRPSLDSAVGAVRLGVVDYIVKPAQVDELLARLDLAVHRGRVLRAIEETEALAGTVAQRLNVLKQVIREGPGAGITGAPGNELGSVARDPVANLPADELARLTPRERSVLRELAKGQSPQRMAETLGLATNTIRNHLKSIFVKLDVNSQVALLAKLTTPRR